MVDGDIPADELAAFEEYRAMVEGTNISPQTLLATDYLNHFNEIVMLFDMLPDMPDMIEECKAWQPKDYKAHFADSTFRDKQLAIEAYDRVPSKFRAPFEETVAQINTLILEGIDRIDREIAAGAGEDQLREHCTALARAAQLLMDCASANIHGTARTMDQAEIDGLLG
ncbi:hypothetical protein [Magnetospirillum sp. UT-4]|uniref:hypothetical protein n=1 Tax=Magnetospirillum sp. UT-4 TaxID=2681467 RepID=UPI00137CB3CD|nr:hypothetical protein [Magnetospirillum sp. UT-4]CAA7618756.1 conserved hypothetical protein [Magnetospirillum sp. UT-4]